MLHLPGVCRPPALTFARCSFTPILMRSLKPVAVVERQADTYTTLLVGIDHLGSIVGLLSTDGRLVQKLSYDACSVSVGFYIKVKPATRTNPPPGGGQPPQPCQLQPALY